VAELWNRRTCEPVTPLRSDPRPDKLEVRADRQEELTCSEPSRPCSSQTRRGAHSADQTPRQTERASPSRCKRGLAHRPVASAALQFLLGLGGLRLGHPGEIRTQHDNRTERGRERSKKGQHRRRVRRPSAEQVEQNRTRVVVGESRARRATLPRGGWHHQAARCFARTRLATCRHGFGEEPATTARKRFVCLHRARRIASDGDEETNEKVVTPLSPRTSEGPRCHYPSRTPNQSRGLAPRQSGLIKQR